MQGQVDLVGLVTYQGGIPARRRSVTHPSTNQAQRSSNQRNEDTVQVADKGVK